MYGQSTGFGQPQNQPSTLFGGNQGGGLFGQPQNQSTGFGMGQSNPQGAGFGQSQGGGLFGQTTSGFGGNQGGGGLFGQSTGGFGQPSQGSGGGIFGGGGGIAGTQPQNLFGASQNTSTGGFGGGFGAQRTATNTLFGASNTMGQGFGATQGGGFGQSQGFGANAGAATFGGGGGFGAQPGPQGGGLFGQSQSQGFGSLGQNTPTFGGQPNLMGQNLNQGQGKDFYQTGPVQPQVSTVQVPFQQQQEQPDPKQPASIFHNIRIQPNYSLPSPQMLRLFDKAGLMGMQVQNYEALAAQEWNSGGKQKYSKLQDLAKIQSSGLGGQPTNAAPGGIGQQNQFGQAQNQFNQGQPSAFSTGIGFASQNNQPLFGGQATGGGGLFGQSQPPSQFGQNQQPGAGGLFGQQQPSTGLGGGFGQPQQNQGGLFGQKPATTGTLFGQPQQQPQGGLFGQPQQQTTTLFGQPSQGAGGGTLFGPQQPSSGLFGQPQQQQQQPGLGGGIFGQQPQQKPAGTLFGGGTQFGQQQTPTQSTLFGQPQQQTPAAGGGLFGNLGAQTPSTGATSTLFGGPATQLQKAPSLFGQPAGTPASGGTLFGGQQAAQPSTGLFGGGGLAQTQSSSLFGNQANQGGGLFGQKPAGTGLFGQQAPSATSSLFSQTPSAQTSLFGGPTSQVGGYNQVPQYQIPNIYQINPDDPYGLNELLTDSKLVQKEAEMTKILETLSRNQQYNPYFKDEKTKLETKPATEFKEPAPKPDLYAEFAHNEIEQLNEKEDIKLRKRVQRMYEESEEQDRKFRPTSYRPSLADFKKPFDYQPDLSRASSYSQTSIFRDRPTLFRETPSLFAGRDSYRPAYEEDKLLRSLSYQTPDSVNLSRTSSRITDPNLINLVVSIPDFRSIKNCQIPFQINNERYTDDIEKKVANIISNITSENLSQVDLILTYKNAVLKKGVKVKDMKFSPDAQIVVNFNDLNEPIREQPKTPTVTKEEGLAPENMLPKPPKAGYTSSPDMIRIARMNLKELQNVDNFTISNQYGSVQWIGRTDLTEVDLGKVVTIVNRSVEVYDDKDPEQLSMKPIVGEKLNKPAKITMNNMLLKNLQQASDEQIQKFFVKHFQNLSENGKPSKFISFDKESQVLVFQVEHFTQFGFEEKEQQEDEKEQSEVEMEPIEKSHVKETTFVQEPLLSQGQPLSNQYLPMSSKSHPQLYILIEGLINYRTTTRVFEPSTKNFTIFNRPPSQEQKLEVSDQVNELVHFKTIREKDKDSDKMSVRSRASQKSRLDESQLEKLIDLQSIRKDSSVKSVSNQFRKIHLASEPERLKQEEERRKRAEMMERIKQRRDLVASAKQNRVELLKRIDHKDFLNVQDSYLKDIKDRTLKLRKPMHQGRPNVAVFKQDGSLFVLSSSFSDQSTLKPFVDKIQVTSTEDDLLTYNKLTEILMKKEHSSLDKTATFAVQSKAKWSVMKQLTDYDTFDDKFFEKMLLQTDFLELRLNTNPTDLFNLLEDLCKYLITVQKEHRDQRKFISVEAQKKLDYQFYTLCLINALFCNPNIHLVQLHPQFKGVKNYDKAKLIYGKGGQQEFQDSSDLITEKKRRNALTEVLRFICQQEFPINDEKFVNTNPDSVYQGAILHLLNGDIQRAINLFNKSQKFKMAQIVCQAVTSTSAQDYIRQLMNTQSAIIRNFSKGCQDLLFFLRGDFDLKSLKPDELFKGLCYYLMFKMPPTIPLTEVLKDFHEKVYHQNFISLNQRDPLPLQYGLIQLYASLNLTGNQLNQSPHLKALDITQKLNSFIGVVAIPKIKKDYDDFRLQYLTLLVLRHLGIHYHQNRGNYRGTYSNFSVSDLAFSSVALKYVKQLISCKDFNQAMLVFISIPNSLSKLKKAYILDCFFRNTRDLMPTNQGYQNLAKFLTQVLQIPSYFLSTVQGYSNLYNRIGDFGVGDFLKDNKLQHFQEVHNIVIHKLAPPYFQHDKQSYKKLLKDRHKLVSYLRYITGQQGIEGWITHGQPILRYLDNLERLKIELIPQLEMQDLNQMTTEIKQITSMLDSKLVQSNLIFKYIWEHLVNLDRALRINLAQRHHIKGEDVRGVDDRFREPLAPMQELIALNPTSDLLCAAYYDPFITESVPLQYSALQASADVEMR